MKWIDPVIIEDEVNTELADINPLLRQLLFVRGIRSENDAKTFLNPSLDQLPDPLLLFDVKKAAKRIEEAIKNQEQIFIHGDFDVDGVTATAILWEYLYRNRKAKALPYIPSRVDEGYGLSERSIKALVSKKAKLIITVDCGIRDVELIDKYRKSSKNKDGVDFIITDHHELGPKFPRFCTIVHPFHPKGNYPFKYLSGAATAWMLIAAMEKLRFSDSFSWENIPGLDLVAFSTVCDMMPLTGINRVLVKFGLDKMKASPRIGLKEMMDEAGILLNDLEAYHLGYILGPRINAAGRIGDATDALKLLTTEKQTAAKFLAGKLGGLNKERQELTDAVLQEVRQQIEDEGTGKHLYFAYNEDWPEGILGLVAGKLQEKYHHPVVVVRKNGNDSRGSARSISCFNMVEAISKYEDLLVRYGGHAQAAGFTIAEENLEKFKAALQQHAQDCLKEEHFVSEYPVDAVVDAADMTWDIIPLIKQMEPFGYGNRRPAFWVKDATIADIKSLSDGKHMRLVVKGGSGDYLSCIFFNGGDPWLSKLAIGDTIDLVGHLEINHWNGEDYLQFNVEDIRAE